jgi:hypothetical protein
MTYDTVVQYVDWGGHTVTVDPIDSGHWIRAGAHEAGDSFSEHRHQMHVKHSRAQDAHDVKHLLSALANDVPQRIAPFTPSVRELEALPKFPSRRNANCDTWRGGQRDLSRVGYLPAIARMHRRLDLPEVDRDTIEAQRRAEERHASARLFSRNGVPDHGVPC